MATADRDRSAQHRAAQHLLGVLKEGLNLLHRFQEGEVFRGYVLGRLWLVAPIGLLMLLTSLGCAAATVLFIGGTRPLLVLLAILLVPFVLAGSFFVQAYVFLSWLESRALARRTHRTAPAPGSLAARLRKLGVEMGSFPPVPWTLAAIFLLAPLAMLVMVAPKLGLALIVLQLVAPVLFARFER
jgi:hypothetical protein